MTYQVLTGGGGLAGWSLLNRLSDRQKEIVANDRNVQNATVHFRDKVRKMGSVDELLTDFRSLSVVLKAFGLEGDIRNKGFIRKILESDLEDKSSLANRLSDKRYRRLAETLGFTNGPEPHINKAGVAEKIVAQYVEREYEFRVGEGDQNLRLALNARRELEDLAGKASTDRAKWFEVLGNTPLKKVFQGAFGFSAAYGKLPIDRQLEEFTRAATKLFGSSDFDRISDPANREKLIEKFILRSSMQDNGASSRFSTALTLLSSAR